MREFNIHLNSRFDSQVEQIIGSDILVESDKWFDYITFSMILPKVNVNIESSDSKRLELLEKQLEKTEISKQIFSKMKDYCDKEHILTFWR